VLDGYGSRVDDVLERRNITEDEDNDNSEDHSGEERPVLRGLVEDGRLLENTEAAGTCSEEVEELPLLVLAKVSLCGIEVVELT
jgi:hypothetical protein